MPLVASAPFNVNTRWQSICRALFVILIAASWLDATAQSSLPPCPTDKAAVWTNCFGTLSFNDGSEYVGDFGADKFHGNGTYTFSTGGKYVGEYRNGKRNGRGVFTFSTGAEYSGEWRDAKQHGQGTLTHPSGMKYVGSWKDGTQSGQGSLISVNGFTIVEGIWLDDQTVSVTDTNWHYATSTENDSMLLFVSQKSIRREGLFRKAWVILGNAQPDPAYKTLSTKGLYKFDCVEERSLRMAASTYSGPFGRGDVLESFSSSQWEYVVPDSVFAYVMKYVCTFKLNESK